MTTLETITQELDRITRERSIDSCPCYARISIEMNIGYGGIGAPEVYIAVSEQGSTVARGNGASLSAAWQAFQDDFNGPDPKSLIRRADAEMGNVPDQASELRRQVAEKSHLKAGLWNWPHQSPGCWAISPGGECYFVNSSGTARPYYGEYIDLDTCVPNAWPIPEAAKPGLRALGVPFDDAPEPVRGLGADAIAIEQAEMEAALSRPDRFEQE